MVRQWQELFYDERYSRCTSTLVPTSPNYKMLGRSPWAVLGFRVESPEEVVDQRSSRQTRSTTAQWSIDFRTRSRVRTCIPWCPAGASTSEVSVDPSHRDAASRETTS